MQTAERARRRIRRGRRLSMRLSEWWKKRGRVEGKAGRRNQDISLHDFHIPRIFTLRIFNHTLCTNLTHSSAFRFTCTFRRRCFSGILNCRRLCQEFEWGEKGRNSFELPWKLRFCEFDDLFLTQRTTSQNGMICWRFVDFCRLFWYFVNFFY